MFAGPTPTWAAGPRAHLPRAREEPTLDTPDPPTPTAFGPRIALRSPEGDLLCFVSLDRPVAAYHPFNALTWRNPADYLTWRGLLLDRARRRLDAGGWAPVLLSVAVEAVAIAEPAPAPGPRPVAAEAATP